MKFSICIPNYNYERFLGRTIQSVLDQQDGGFEILVCDNASTDRSTDVVRGFADPRIKLHVNNCNVGFGGNLDRVARMSQGDLMILLSSDDLMRPDALATYQKFYELLAGNGRRAMITSACDVIDAEDRITDMIRPNRKLWRDSDRVPHLESVAGGPVYGVPGCELLRRTVELMENPFNFAATCYPRNLYDAVEGYGGGRLINPDKWFHWKVLGVAEMAYYIDRPLFAYRWHASNQGAQESAAGALKFMVDEYVSTIELDAKVLERIGLTRDAVAKSFVENDIACHGLTTLARGERTKARRMLNFGRAVYPQHVRRNRKAWALSAMLALGPLGQKIAQIAYRTYEHKNGRRDRAD